MLKSAVKEVEMAQTEELSRNLIVFGLKEEVHKGFSSHELSLEFKNYITFKL